VPTAVLVSFRLGSVDGVSVVAASWHRALVELGFTVTTVAGEGTADHVLPSLATHSPTPPTRDALLAAIGDPDVVLVENVLTIPMNVPVSLALADVLHGRPAVLHHHDPPWQNPGRQHVTDLPVDDPAWRHVVINHRTLDEFAERGLDATLIYNSFDADPPAGDRSATRARLGVADDEALLLHLVRAIERKNVPGAVKLAEAVGGTYWLPGPAEDGYGPTLDSVLAAATTRVLRVPVPPVRSAVADAYAACDAVVYPSHWEGFGMPPIEAALHGRPVAVGAYPVAEELAGLGFRWLPADDPAPLAAALADPTTVAADIAHNRHVVARHLSHDVMRERLAAVLEDVRQ
jgi:glycosyltransferase involved in cell wall biosynthesis